MVCIRLAPTSQRDLQRYFASELIVFIIYGPEKLFLHLSFFSLYAKKAYSFFIFHSKKNSQEFESNLFDKSCWLDKLAKGITTFNKYGVTRVTVIHILINISLFKHWHVWRNAKTAVRLASSRSLVRYFTGPIGLDEDEFLKRFFYDHM